MPIFEVKGTEEDLTEDILDAIIDDVKLIKRIQNQTDQSKMLMFQTYFRGLKEGLKIASGGRLNEEDPIILMITHDIIYKVVSGKLSDKEAWQMMLTFETNR